MDQEIQKAKLNQLLVQLRAQPKTAEVIFDEHQELWRTLNFSQAQVGLWLASLRVDNEINYPGADYNVTPDISSHLIELLQKAGGRMPLAQVLKKLPAGVVTSEQQIRKLVQQHSQLQVKGPFLVLQN
ncbi:hypothetical protein [Vibrio antiquarius]|uniref:hypothetical protein n=1 Tax=Vibrio antiquarius (strain Ex25) TaxID=150340 RepID=UPI002658DEB1|nr:hypothetical protein [Vibrio antiquarius]MCR9915750.1 hypothetical protein [Vibrio antiquarius]